MKRVHEFKDAWRWPDDVERFIRDQCQGEVLHVCCGGSQLGDVRVDADPRHDPDVVADMYNLPFPDFSFGTVVVDPPWKSVDIFDRHGLFYEVVRVTDLGGRIIHNATWLPESEQCEKVGEYRRADKEFMDASVISIHERYPGQQTLDGLG